MAVTNKIKFFNQEKTTESVTTSAVFTLQGTILDADKLTANNRYVMVSWINCKSPGTNDGGSKLSFEGGAGDITGSVQQRHDTNSVGMAVSHIGEFVAPDPPENIGIYRKRVAGSAEEETAYGQCFAIDLSFSGDSGSLQDGTNYSSSTSTSTRTEAPGGVFHSHTVNHGGSNLILASAKVFDNTDTALIGLYLDTVLIASGSRFTQDPADIKEVVFAVAQNITSGQKVEIKNIDADVVNTDYTYVFALNLDSSPAVSETGKMTSWADYGSSGSWGSKVMDGNAQPSFVVAMGRQTNAGLASGRPAGVSLRNNTAGEWMLFNSRPSGDFSPLYFPATNYGQDTGQKETSVIVGVGTISDTGEIELVTI
jgi:hypothetical protein